MEVQTLPPFPVDSVGLKDGVGRSSNSYPHGNTKQAARIPLPDQSAFESDRYMNSSPPSIPKMCPPTPARTPAWAQKGLGPPTRLVRRSSLNCTKILLELPVFQGTPDGKFKFQEEYVNLGKIGMGTFSEVFCVRSRSDQQMYAIKKSKRKFLSKRDRALFMQEVENFQRLGPHCDHIIDYYRAWQEDAHFYIQMELCERGNLEDFLQALVAEGTLIPEATIWNWASHMTSALRHIHAAKVIHLDVKPQNVFLAKDGQLKLGDLGLARQYSSQEDGMEGDSRYMAPELLSASKMTAAVDIFSLGIMLFQISSQFTNLPEHGKFWGDLRHNKIPAIRDTYSRELFQLITQMMTRDPAARPTAWQLMHHKQIEKALDLLDDFVVTTPLKSTPGSHNRTNISSRFQSDSALSDSSMWSTESGGGTPHSLVRTVTPTQHHGFNSFSSSLGGTPISTYSGTPSTGRPTPGTVLRPRVRRPVSPIDMEISDIMDGSPRVATNLFAS